MNESDIEFTVDLDMSPAEQKLRQFESNMPMADAAFQRVTGSFTPQQNTPPNIGPTGAAYPRSGAMAESFFEKSVAANLEKEADRLSRSHASLYDKIKDAFFSRKTSDKFDAASNGGVPPTPPPTENDVVDDEDAKKTDEIKQNEEAITGEAKAQNREMNEHHIKLGKTLTILGLIKAAVDAIKKTWTAAFDTQAKLNKETGFLSSDPHGAFTANTDRSYAMFLRGIANLGKASPFKGDEVDSLMKLISKAREDAMSGKGVDERLSTAVELLNKTFGTNFNVVQLLTGDPSRTNFDIVKEITEAVEKGIPNMAKMPEGELNRTMSYLKQVLGDNFLDALMTNYNMNLITGDTRLAMEKVMTYGTSAVTDVNVAEATKQITEAGATLKNNFEQLSQTILKTVEPAFTNFITNLSGLTTTIEVMIKNRRAWLPKPVADYLDWRDKRKEQAHAAGIPTLLELIFGSKDDNVFTLPALVQDITLGEDARDALRAIRTNPDYKKKANEKYKNAKSVYDIFEAQILSSSEYGSEFGGGWIEDKFKEAIAYEMYDRAIKGQLGDTPYETAVKSGISKGSLPIDDIGNFISALKNLPTYIRAIDDELKEGGSFDVTTEKYLNPKEYILGMLSDAAKGEYLRNWGKTLNPATTGGYVLSAGEREFSGHLYLNINMADATGRTAQSSFEIPMGKLPYDVQKTINAAMQ